MLAQSGGGGVPLSQIFGFLVFFLVFIFPVIRGLLGGKKKGGAGARRSPKRGSGAQGIDIEAMRRRQQLQQEAERRQQQASAGGAGGGGGGLTMAERIARARQAQQGGASRPPAAPTPARRPTPAPARSASRPAAGSAERDLAEKQRRAAEARVRQQREQLARRQQEAQAQRARREAARRQAAAAQAKQAGQRPARGADHYQEEHGTHRLVADAPDVGEALAATDLAAGEIGGSDNAGRSKVAQAAAAPFVFNAANLREAFVMKELLDAPVALRNDAAI